MVPPKMASSPACSIATKMWQMIVRLETGDRWTSMSATWGGPLQGCQMGSCWWICHARSGRKVSVAAWRVVETFIAKRRYRWRDQLQMSSTSLLIPSDSELSKVLRLSWTMWIGMRLRGEVEVEKLSVITSARRSGRERKRWTLTTRLSMWPLALYKATI